MAPTPVGALNQDLTLNTGTTYLLWVRVENTGAIGGTGFIWQYSHQAGPWIAITTTSDVVRASPALTFLDNDDVPQTLTGAGTYVTNNDAATEDGTTTLPANFPAGGAIEFVLAFTIRSAAAGIATGQQGQIRLALTGGTALNSYTQIFDYTVNIVAGFTGLPANQALTLPTSHPVWGTGETWSDGTRFSDGQGWAPEQAGALELQLGSITATRFAPTLALNHFLAVSPGSLALTRHAPTVSATNAFQGAPASTSLILTPRLPTISVGSTLAVGSSAQTLNEFAAILSASSAPIPADAALAFTGRIPVIATGTKTAATTTRAVALTGQIPVFASIADFTADIDYDIFGSVTQNVAVSGSAQVSPVAVAGSGISVMAVSGHAAVAIVSIRGSMTAESIP